MMKTVAERGRYFYYYSEFLLARLMQLCCSCCCRGSAWYERRTKKLQRHNDATERLDKEIDIVKLLYVQRVGQFIAKLFLKRHQRALITTFREY